MCVCFHVEPACVANSCRCPRMSDFLHFILCCVYAFSNLKLSETVATVSSVCPITSKVAVIAIFSCLEHTENLHCCACRSTLLKSRSNLPSQHLSYVKVRCIQTFAHWHAKYLAVLIDCELANLQVLLLADTRSCVYLCVNRIAAEFAALAPADISPA